MLFDTDHPIVVLCAQGMEMEGKGEAEEAAKLFMSAWDKADDDFEKAIAAHYVARHQNNIENKLDWDIEALNFALNCDKDKMGILLPTMYLNIANVMKI